MTKYNNFIGIDIGKDSFVVNVHGQKATKEYDNDPAGFALFLQEREQDLAGGLCVLETTGGYETALSVTLCDKHLAVHRANTRHVKSFIRSWGNGAKTDSLDSKALALYGFERKDKLALFNPKTDEASQLYELTQRRDDLVKTRAAEKNRVQAPGNQHVKQSYEAVIKVLDEQIDLLNARINLVIQEDAILSKQKAELKTIPGIGDIAANNLLAFIPELGELDRRQVASLVGLAPRANDSGKRCGYRSTVKGRSTPRRALFTAAMAAARSHSKLGEFYEQLLAKGKKKMVALVALMRKIIVIANAKMRDLKKCAELQTGQVDYCDWATQSQLDLGGAQRYPQVHTHATHSIMLAAMGVDPVDNATQTSTPGTVLKIFEKHS